MRVNLSPLFIRIIPCCGYISPSILKGIFLAAYLLFLFLFPALTALAEPCGGIDSAADSKSETGYTDILPGDAYDLMNPEDPSHIANALILDVRSQYEWLNDGHPGVSSSGEGPFLEGKVVNIPYEFRTYDAQGQVTSSEVNPNFVLDVEERFLNQETLVIICRTGNRSVEAATLLDGSGYSLYNVLLGFNFWKLAGLPFNYDREGIYRPYRIPLPVLFLLLDL